MRKLQLIFLWILTAALCGCGKTEEPSEITFFSFTHTGMSTEQCYLYSAEQTEDGIRLYTEELFSGGLIVDEIVEEPVTEQLDEIVGRYRLDQWDGFDKKDRHVTDGNHFSLSITFADGKSISARGSNRFPDGYEDAKQEICRLFEDLTDKYGKPEPERLEPAEPLTETEPEPESCLQWYQTVLDSNYELIMGGADSYEYRDGTSGIGEVIMNSDEIAAGDIGYTFLDVNHDGVAELIIGSISEEKEGKYFGENIYSVYTYSEIPHLLLEGWSRNRCFLLEDGTFYTEGSGGAMYTILENYVLDVNATQLSCKDFYFTYEKDESFEEIGFYHNTTEEMDVSASEELEEDAFWSIFEEYGSRTVSFELVPFSKHQYVGEQNHVKSSGE